RELGPGPILHRRVRRVAVGDDPSEETIEATRERDHRARERGRERQRVTRGDLALAGATRDGPGNEETIRVAGESPRTRKAGGGAARAARGGGGRPPAAAPRPRAPGGGPPPPPAVSLFRETP